MEPTDRDLRSVTDAIASATGPIAFTSLSSALSRGPSKITRSCCREALKILEKDGRIFVHPPGRAGDGPRYWYKDIVSFVAEQILKKVDSPSKRPRKRETVRGNIQKFYVSFFDKVVDKLIKEGKLLEIHTEGESKLSTKRLSIADVITKTDKKVLERIIRKTASCRQKRLTVGDVLAFLEYSVEVVPPRSQTMDVPTKEPEIRSLDALKAAYDHFASDYVDGYVPIFKVRRNLNWSRDQFDALVKDLNEREHRILDLFVGEPSSFSEDEIQDSLRRGRNVYVRMRWRKQCR